MEPFGMVEKAVKQVIVLGYPESAGRVGGDMNYQAGQPFYTWIGLVAGQTDRVFGEWSVDVDVMASSYSEAMDRALDLETLLLRGRHFTSVMILDSVFQNAAPVERPWNSEGVFRVGATYTLTARRPG